jgi:hypothetical protein
VIPPLLLQADPSLWPSAVEEILRYHTASAFALRRVALQEVAVGGEVGHQGAGWAGPVLTAPMLTGYVLTESALAACCG